MGRKKAVIPDFRITALCFSTAFPTSELPGQVQGVILLTRSEIHKGTAGISQQTSSPSIFYLSSLIPLACQQEFAEIIARHTRFKSQNLECGDFFSYQLDHRTSSSRGAQQIVHECTALCAFLPCFLNLTVLSFTQSLK